MPLNAWVLRLLESPAHRLLPGGLTEISYTGPLSGNAIRLPVQSVADGRRFLVLVGRPDHKKWWRTFRSPQPARLLRDGRQHDVIGRVLAGSERADALVTYLAAHPAARRAVGTQTPVVAFALVAS